MKVVTEPSTSVRRVLTRDHARLEVLFCELLEAIRADAQTEADRAFRDLEEELQAHLAAEEEHVLPSFARLSPDEAQALREEHQVIRRQLAELGIGVELHAVPEPVASAFIEALRAHAHREEALLYRWLDSGLEPCSQRALLSRLFGRVRPSVAPAPLNPRPPR